MRCFSCRQEIPADSEYCPRCGKPQGFAKELLERAAAGDQNAVTELYNGTYPQVCATIRSIVRDEDAAMDILQNTYIKGFQNLGMLDRPGSFRPWIRSIARNRAVDWVRKKKPVLFSQMENEEGGMQDFVDDRPDHLPETVIDRQETARLLQEMLDGLPEDQRACIAMFYYEEMSLKEIAAALRVSENTVKSRLNYAKKKLRGKVEELEKRGTKLYGLAGAPAVLLVPLAASRLRSC